MRFLTNDDGASMGRMGADAEVRSYVIGNPLVAQTMITHDPGVGLNVPIEVVIFQTSAGEVRLAYDLPSSLIAPASQRRRLRCSSRLDASSALWRSRDRRGPLKSTRKLVSGTNARDVACLVFLTNRRMT